MAFLALTVLGHDRPGIIADVTRALADIGGNLEDSSMTLLRGHFAWMLIVDVEAEPEDVTQRLGFLADEGLVISVLPMPAEAAPDTGEQFILTVHGADRPGIVSRLTGVIAEQRGNITDLSTRLGAGGMYLLVAEVELPHDADVATLTATLTAAARELGVDASLRPGEPDMF